MELKKKTAIVVVNYKTPWHLNECLSSVYSHTSDFHLFVVHNTIDPESIKVTDKFTVQFPGSITVIQNEKNLGFVDGVNSTYDLAKNYYRVCFLNSDTIVTSGWLSTMNKVLDENPNVVQVAPDFNHYYPDGKFLKLFKRLGYALGESIGQKLHKVLMMSNVQHSEDTGFLVSNTFYQFCSGACNVARIEPFLERGFFFDPNIIHGYGDDFDTTYYLRQFGDIGVTNDAYVFHFLNVSVNKFQNEKSELKEKIKTLNMFYVASKYEDRLTQELDGKSPEELLYLQHVSYEVKTLFRLKGMCQVNTSFKKYIDSIPARALWERLTNL